MTNAMANRILRFAADGHMRYVAKEYVRILFKKDSKRGDDLVRAVRFPNHDRAAARRCRAVAGALGFARLRLRAGDQPLTCPSFAIRLQVDATWRTLTESCEEVPEADVSAADVRAINSVGNKTKKVRLGADHGPWLKLAGYPDVRAELGVAVASRRTGAEPGACSAGRAAPA